MKTIKTLLTGMVLGGLVYHYGIEKSRHITVKSYQVSHPNVKNNFRIALVTDLHSNLIGNKQEKIINMIASQEPTLILLGGDIIDEDLPIENAQQFLNKVVKLAPTYYVTGNHEFYRPNLEDLKNMISDFQIQVLEGHKITLKIGQTFINLFGIDDQASEKTDKQLAAFSNMSIDHQAFNILLAHRPEQFSEYLAAYPFDLILSGHAHGGQWRIPNIINGIYAPGQGIFPKFAGGYYELEEAELIVSRGLERQKNKVPRIFNQPELVVIDVVGEQ